MSRLLLAAACVALVLAAITSHGAANAQGNALFIDGNGCMFVTGDGGFTFAPADTVVVTTNVDGTTSCQAAGVPNSSGAPAHFDTGDSLGCVTSAGLGATWQEDITADGVATLTCAAP